MNPLIAYFKSAAGILRIICMITTAILIGLSSYSHFNSHWTFHARIVQREEVTDLNKLKLEELRNEYEECRYNSRIYSGITLIKDSPEMINGFGAREYSSTNEKTCPNPILELFLVCVSICVFVVSIVSMLVIFGVFPKLVTRESIGPLRFSDMMLFGLATIFLLIGMSLFWYSTYHISEWCTLKSLLYDFKSSSAKGYLKISHAADTVDIITGEAVSTTNPIGARMLLSPSAPAEGPAEVFYLSRAKRHSETLDFDDFESNESPIRSDDQDQIHFTVGKTRREQYLELCLMRQMTTEKYWTVAVAFLATVLHGAAIVLVYRRWSKTQVDNADRNTIADNHDESRERRNSARSHDFSMLSHDEEVHSIIRNKNRLSVPRPDENNGNKRVSFDDKAVGPD